MARAPSDRDFRPEDVRSHRQRNPPVWLKDYEVDLPRPIVFDQERPAEMTPLPQYTALHHWSVEGTEGKPSASPYVPLYESTPIPSQHTPPTLEVLQQLREDNRKLHQAVLDMQCRMDKSYALSPPHPLLLASEHSPSVRMKPTVADTPHQPVHQSAIAEEDEAWPPPPPPVAIEERPRQPNPDHRIIDVLKELKERILKLELKPSSPPPTPDYQQPDDDTGQSESWSSLTNIAAPTATAEGLQLHRCTTT